MLVIAVTVVTHLKGCSRSQAVIYAKQVLSQKWCKINT